MSTPEKKSLDEPDETRPIEKGRVEVVELDAGTVMRTTFEPRLALVRVREAGRGG